jgi:uncharacterized protein YbbK (DUF523 family)
MTKICVSACLAGERCRYDGNTNEIPEIRKLVEEGKAVPVCPEVWGGLPVPRIPSERRGTMVINREGTDVTEAYMKGSRQALETCLKEGCQTAVLKARSPACGHGRIYDGTFTKTLIDGNGTFADMLEEHGINVMTEEEFIHAK